MNSPREEYSHLSKLNNIEELASYTLFDKYLIENRRAYEKLTFIDSTDQESLIIGLNGGMPITGMIYTFYYGEPTKVKVKGVKDKVYQDIAPLVFCLKSRRDHIIGLNLNMLPVNNRLEFLQQLYVTFPEYFDDAETKAQNNILSFNTRLMDIVGQGKIKQLIIDFNNITGNAFHYAYRKYKFEKIRDLRMIEISEWKYIPFYEPKNAFRKMSYSKIQNLYYQKLHE